ncbi:hypothetical protein [Caballeronia sp. HLA56]
MSRLNAYLLQTIKRLTIMKDLQVSVDSNGRVTTSHSMAIGEHCANRARLLSSLVNIVAAPGGFEHFCSYPETMRRDILSLLHSVAEEQMPLIAALEEHTARASFEKGVQTAREFMAQEQAANAALHFDAEQAAQAMLAH